MRRFWVLLFSLYRSVSCYLILVSMQLRFGSFAIPNDLKVNKGIRVSVTDAGRLSISRSCSIDCNATIIVKYGELVIGEGCYIGIGSVICARESISIGSNVLIAEYVTIRDQDHEFDATKRTDLKGFTTHKIIIGDNAWLGAKVTVTKGVTIGHNSIIGANSVVTADIPPNVIAAGSPARVIRELT